MKKKPIKKKIIIDTISYLVIVFNGAAWIVLAAPDFGTCLFCSEYIGKEICLSPSCTVYKELTITLILAISIVGMIIGRKKNREKN